MNMRVTQQLLHSFIVVIAAIVTGCAVGPEYVKPTLPSAPAFKEMSGWKRAQPKDDQLRGSWWELFGDRQLNDLENQVDVSNQNLAAAEARVRQAKAIIEAGRSGFYPSVTLGASASRAHAAGKGTASSFNLPVDASWEPDLWGRIRRTVEADQANAQATMADLEGARLSAHAQLAQTYFQLRTVEAQKKLFQAAVANFDKTLQLTRNRYAAGLVSRADVLQAETQVKTTSAQLVDLNVQRSQLEHAIALLVGKPASSFNLTVSPLDVTVPAVPVAVPSAILERRPDIAAAERRVAAANAQIGIVEAAYYPQIALSASAGLQSAVLGNWLSLPSRVWSVGAALSQTLFDGGLRKAQTAEARAAYDEIVANYRQTALVVFQEVEDNLAALRLLEEEGRLQNEAVEAASSSLAVTTNQYNAGLVSYLEVVVSQTTALNSERTAADILGRRMTATVLLIKALGGGWDPTSMNLSETAANSGTKPVGHGSALP